MTDNPQPPDGVTPPPPPTPYGMSPPPPPPPPPPAAPPATPPPPADGSIPGDPTPEGAVPDASASDSSTPDRSTPVVASASTEGPQWGEPLPLYEAPPPPPAKRSRGRALMVAVGGVALVAASAFAVWALTQPDGSESPDGAVHTMFSAVDHQDALGVIESLPPGERKVLRDPLVDANKELHRLGVLKSLSLSDVPGADLKVEGLQLTDTRLSDDVVAVEVVGGTVSGKSIPKDIPLGDPVRQIIQDNGGDTDFQESTFTHDFSQDHLRLVAIKEGGGWHVSVAYSIAEAIRMSSEDEDGKVPPVPDFGNGVQPVGAETPEGAVQALADAATSYDAEKAIAMTDPEEMRALYDYAPLFLPKVARSTQQAEDDDQPVFTVSKLETSVEGDGTTRRVRITGFDVSVKSSSSSTHVTYDGQCYDVTSTSTYLTYRDSYSTSGSLSLDPTVPPSIPKATPKTETHTEHHCAGDDSTDTSDDGSMSGFGTLGMFGSSTDEPFAITVSQVDGRWYVSPVRTVLDSLVEGLRRLQPSDIEKFAKSWSSSSDSESFSSVGSAVGGSSSDPSYPSDPSNPSDPSYPSYPTATTMVAGNASGALFPGLSPQARQVVESECSTAYDAATRAGADPLGATDSTYYQAIAALYRCASHHSAPGYAPCLPLLDNVVTLADDGTDAELGRALSQAQACVAQVHS